MFSHISIVTFVEVSLLCFLFFISDFTLMSSLLPNVSCIFMLSINHAFDDKTISNTLSPLVGSSTC